MLAAMSLTIKRVWVKLKLIVRNLLRRINEHFIHLMRSERVGVKLT
jgi:hypothetical protein